MFISPMLLEQIETPFSSATHIFEPKINGHRLILSHMNGETRFWTRNHFECTRQYPELWNVPVDGDVVLDGEVCCQDPETGRTAYKLVMERFNMKKRNRIHSAANHRPVQFVVFDILYRNGEDLRELPLMKRKSILHSVLKANEFFSPIIYLDDNGEELFKLFSGEGEKLEGIVAKKKDSIYVSRRSHDWLKIVHSEEAAQFVSI